MELVSHRLILTRVIFEKIFLCGLEEPRIAVCVVLMFLKVQRRRGLQSRDSQPFFNGDTLDKTSAIP
jgi:hypothetical protein